MAPSIITVKVNTRINDDGQIVITESGDIGRVSDPIVYSRAMSLRIAAAVISKRITEGSMNSSMTLAELCVQEGTVAKQYNYDDRTVIERWEPLEAT